MDNVTVTGGTGHTAITLPFNTSDTALAQARILAASIDTRVSSAQYYQSFSPATTSGAAGGSVIASSQGTTATTMSFVGGSSASTVLSGSGSYIIQASTGADDYHAASGQVTIFGGSTLSSGFGISSIVAGAGNETLVAGQGQSTLTGGGKDGVTDDLTKSPLGFDFLSLSRYGVGEAEIVPVSAKASDGHASFALQDGTKVVLEGVTSLTKNNFH